MAYTPEQKRIARVFAQELKRAGASPRVQKALYEAGLVESGLRNVNYGDRDSLGVLQERSHYGSSERRLNPRLAARRFIDEATALNQTGQYGKAGDLAQATQRSAFPDRYQQRGGEADALRAKFLGSGATMRSPSGRGPSPSSDTPAPEDISGLLAGLLPKRQAPMVSGPAAPAFAAHARGAGPTPVSGSGGPTRQSVDDLLRAALATESAEVPRSSGGGGSAGGGTGGNGGTVRPGGAYEGTTRIVRDLAKLSGLQTSSGKRDTKLTASGNPSDHWVGSKNANARDLIGTGDEMRQGASRIARQLGIPKFSYGNDYNVTKRIGGGTFRFQLITSPHGSGPHVHIGVARVK